MRGVGDRRAGIELDEIKENENVYEELDKKYVNNDTYDNVKTEKKTKNNNTRQENMDKTKVVIVLLCIVVAALVVAVVTVSSIVFFGVTDGGWTDWEDWGACSVTCGTGFATRMRTCSNPRPSIMGRYCNGTSLQVQSCNNTSCSGFGNCYNNPCVHGNCYENEEGYLCVCETGYEGQRCENKTDYCQSSPCVHGRCVSNIANYTCICGSNFTGERCETVIILTDCYDIYTNNISSKSGVYSVMLWRSKQRIEVYCDMDTYPYGWTVFQKRFNGSVDFYRNFTEYTNGFGNLRGEFWLGLRYIEEMASQYESELRLDVVAADNDHGYEVFQNFSLTKYPKFTLHLGKKTVDQISNRTDGFSFNNGFDFSTFDHGADVDSRNCGQLQRGGWWYGICSPVNLNGEYLTPPGGTSTYYNGFGGFVYYPWKQYATLKSSQIMFRKYT